jgi:hypothetical protein
MNESTIEGTPRPKLIGISTDWLDSSREIFGPNIAIALAIIRDAWQVALPARLDPVNIKPKVTDIRQGSVGARAVCQ